MPGWTSDSLRSGLIRRLVGALALTGVLGGVAAYTLGTRYANLAYDRALSDDVSTLASQIEVHDGRVQVNLPPSARQWLLANEGERVIYRVIDLRDARVLDGNADLGRWADDPERRGTVRFRDVVIDRARFRVGFVAQNLEPGDVPVLVEVGETLGQRQLMAQQILGGSLALVSLMIAVAVWMVWLGVGTALNPLQLLEAEAARRSGVNLTPLEPRFAPVEVRGLILAINRMMQRVSQAIDAQSRFIANAAHQLRTPMAGLRLQAQLAMEDDASPSVHARVAEIDRAAERAAHLIDQLLSLSRAESDELLAAGGRVDLVQTVHAVIERHMAAAIARDIDLGYEGEPGAAVVQGNEALLAELLANLVDNAIRYGRTSGKVTVALHEAGEVLRLSVCDDGPGLPAADAPQELFKRFHRPDSAATRAVQGAGLGLAIVKEIAERHGARVAFGAAPGGGAQVSVDFPRPLRQSHDELDAVAARGR